MAKCIVLRVRVDGDTSGTFYNERGEVQEIGRDILDMYYATKTVDNVVEEFAYGKTTEAEAIDLGAQFMYKVIESENRIQVLYKTGSHWRDIFMFYPNDILVWYDLPEFVKTNGKNVLEGINPEDDGIEASVIFKSNLGELLRRETHECSAVPDEDLIVGILL